MLFRRLAERALDGWAVAFAVALCALGVPFIRYAAEVKQYEADATAAILLLVLAVDLRSRATSSRRLWLTALAGLVVPWFSQAAVLVMAGIGLGFAIEWLLARDDVSGRVLLRVMPFWAAGALTAVIAGLRSMSPATREFMHDFWATGFFPLPLDSVADLGWFWRQASSAFEDPTLLRYRWPELFLVVASVGFAVLWRSRRDVALLLLGPLAVAAAAALAQQYPFRGRLMFYLVPCLLLAIAAGAEWMRRLLGRSYPWAGGPAMAALLVWPVAALVDAPPPYPIEEHRGVLAYLERHRRPGDAVHAFPLSRIGLLYYGPRYGLEPAAWTTGTCDRTDTRAFLRDVDRYRGTPRLWLVSAGARPFRSARAAVREYLSTIGAKRDSVLFRSLQFAETSLELYDLSDSVRLRATSAERFPVAPMPTDPPPGCRPWIRPSPLDTFP